MSDARTTSQRAATIRLVDCGHIAGFHDAEGALLDVPELCDEFEIRGAAMYLASEIFRLKRTHAVDADGETYFLDAPEYAPAGTRWRL